MGKPGAGMPCFYSLLSFRRRGCAAGASGRGRGFCSGFLRRAGSIAGLVVVVDLAMSSAIASRDMKRRHPMTTLASWPLRNKA